MIVKVKDARPTVNKFEQAGDAAEEQMAFYLRRAFGDSPDIFVYNDLRLVDGDDAAQIDHLVLHTHGMFIVESKSVSGEVTVNDKDEWVRKWGSQKTGMPSPIQQARLQGEFLRKLLKAHKETLRDKYIFGMLQGGFGHCPIGICVAISDRGVITRRKADPPELCKADKVCERIREEIERHRKGAKLLSKPDGDYGVYSFRPQEMERIKEFLLARHCPRDAQVQVPTPAAVITKPAKAESQPKPIDAPSQQMEGAACKHCGSDKLQAVYGQFGYYFKCSACGKNTPMDFTCRSCGAKARIRKQGAKFDRVCGCGEVQLVWTNKD